MSEVVRYEFDVPSEVHARLIDLQSTTGLTTSELLIGAAELLYNKPTQGIMKRIARGIAARRFEVIMQNFPARTRGKKAVTDETEQS